ncbi:ETEC_3214 domain-containing protein [Marinomonas polaris]|jgi:hypothetical protein|uniref:ETEC_3214 domain-containing protein n=1 Tax=Marinomonas TaxID=28253 RepID=UPI000C28325E|nr:ETEC_3214 domain-containing protein [Marinomonas sp. ef1]
MDNVPSEKPRFIKRVQSLIFTIAAVMLSIGQWSDTKQMSIEAYEGFIAQFTDKIELERLSKVKVGGNLNFIEQTFGIATVIKSSQTIKNLEYRYYPDSKYILAIAAQNNSIKGYQVISLDNSFYPVLPFSEKKLGGFVYSEYSPYFDEIRSDDVNLTYYLESHSLGRAGLFFNQFITYVGYGASYSESVASGNEISLLNESMLQKGQDQSSEIINKLRAMIKPNVFSIGDIDASTAADMLVTRYEYAAYFKGE